MASIYDDTKSTSSGDKRNEIRDGATHTTQLPKKNSRKRKSQDKSRANKSWVWVHFNGQKIPLMINQDGKEIQVGHTTKDQCKYCSSTFNAESKNGTSTLQKHLEIHCSQYPSSAKNSIKGQSHFATDVKGVDASVTHWTQENCTKPVVEMIVIDEMPFSAIEKPGFRRFCQIVVPKWNFPCRKTVVKTFLGMYGEMKESLRIELRYRCVSLTTDTWTSIQNINYMVLTAHFINDNWIMHKKVLNFCVIPNHQDLTIGKILEKCFQEWSIKNLLTVSVYNAASNKVALDYIKRKLNNGDKEILLGGEYLHVRCLAHVANLIIKLGLRCLEKSVASIRNAIKYVRSSPSRLETFKECVKKESLESKKVCVLDVPTRWNSTYIMLEMALELRQAFDRLLEEEDLKYTGYFDEEDDGEGEEDELDLEIGGNGKKMVGPPNEDDWGRALELVKFLRVFYEATMNISSSNKPSANKSFIEVVGIKYEIDNVCNYPYVEDNIGVQKVIFDMSVHIKSKYRKYLDKLEDINQLLLVALVLDPRRKLRFFMLLLQKMMGFYIDLAKKKCDELKKLIVTLTDIYASTCGTPNQMSNLEKEVIQDASSSANKRCILDRKASLFEEWEKDLQEGNQVVVTHEVERFILDPIEVQDEEFDILAWWKLVGSKYPNLQNLAKDILAIQVSTVASESSFSTGKRVIDPHRSSLTPRSIEALIFLQNWLKSDAITNLQYAPTPEEMEWFEKTEQEFEQEVKELMEKKSKVVKTSKEEKELMEKKSKVVKTSKVNTQNNLGDYEFSYV